MIKRSESANWEIVELIIGCKGLLCLGRALFKEITYEALDARSLK